MKKEVYQSACDTLFRSSSSDARRFRTQASLCAVYTRRPDLVPGIFRFAEHDQQLLLGLLLDLRKAPRLSLLTLQAHVHLVAAVSYLLLECLYTRITPSPRSLLLRNPQIKSNRIRKRYRLSAQFLLTFCSPDI